MFVLIIRIDMHALGPVIAIVLSVYI